MAVGLDRRRRAGRRTTGTLACLAALLAALTVGGVAGATSSQTAPGGTLPGSNGMKSGDQPVHPPTSGAIVYWDQDEEEDYYLPSTGALGQLETPWDPNGQMCIVPHTDGDYVVGYDPTNPTQHNPGGPSGHPFKDPPIGEELQNHYGVWTGQNLYVPGPYALKKGEVGGDSPKGSNGEYNGLSTYTGCATDAKGDVFGDDLGTAQGTFPVPHDGRLVEWFAPKHTEACILMGPTSGGVGPHHVDGTGGLAQPGMMTTATNGDLLMPEAGSPSGQGFGGEVMRIAHTSLPKSESTCPGGEYPAGRLHTSVFIQGNNTFLPFPMAIAKDPECDCYAVDTAFGDPAIAFFNKTGQQMTARPTIPGEPVSTLGAKPTGFNPFGMAFTPTGTLYFIDIHIVCQGGTLSHCGPGNYDGRVMEVPFTSGDQPVLPPKVVDSDFAFPTSVTVCVFGHGTVCPFPAYKTPKPSPETKAEGG